jgi:dihydroorotase
MSDRLILRQPDDWHLHLRDGAMLTTVVPYTARQFARAIVMPNLVPPVTTVAAATAYRDRIRKAVPAESSFQPLMSCYLTDASDPNEIERGYTTKVWAAAKLYPAHATTNSAHGVTDMKKLTHVFERMQRIGMPLLLHGEVTEPGVDIFDRENVFIDKVLTKLLDDFPDLKIVLEHITTAEAVDFLMSVGSNIAATITPHHLMISRNALFEGGIRPHLYCLPIVKRERHRRALRRAATSGSAKFFLGTDSAPHAVHTKENACGCAGIFNAPFALELYAQVFDEEQALDKLEGFASLYGPAFYGLPANDRHAVLERGKGEVPTEIGAGNERLLPFAGPNGLTWRFMGLVEAAVSEARPRAGN